MEIKAIFHKTYEDDKGKEYIEENCEKEWNRWTSRERLRWLVSHELAGSNSTFEFQPNEVKDALFCEYLDNAKRELEAI